MRGYVWSLVVLGLGSGIPSWQAQAQEPAAVRPQAVVDLTFDEDSGPAKDAATVGSAADEGQLRNEPVRVSSPFWNQPGKRALELNASRQQFVEIADSTDVDRPEAVSFSLLAVNLLSPSEGGFRGLVAKRGVQDGKTLANYGINLNMQSDVFQVYLNDGSGYRVVQYAAKDVFPVRKLTHLTATFLVADAPGQDTDTDVDDVRIQLFVNGQPATPKSVNKGFINGTEGWITDIAPDQLLNDLPVTIGRSDAGGEYLSAVVDEFLLFPKALSSAEAKQLFLEVAGSDVEQLIQADKPGPPPRPELVRLSQPGLTVGQSTRLVIVGKNLAPESRIITPVEGITWEFVGDPKPEQLVVTATVTPQARPGIYPLYIATSQGISAPLPFAVDILRHVPAAEVASPEKPVTLPAAVFGNLAGGQEPRVYFVGKQGQRFVADVELKRLGGKANPVLELKAANGRPVTIAWGDSQFAGDVRLEYVLPADGVYAIELHDLVYRAPGPNAYRLKLGDLTLIDHLLPVAARPGLQEFEPIGTGLPAQSKLTAEVSAAETPRKLTIALPAAAHVAAPWPVVRSSEGQEIVEAAVEEGNWQTIDATLPAGSTYVAIHGRLATPQERDQYLLNVTPGQKLRLELAAPSLRSPVVGELEILGHPQGNRLAISGDQPSETDPALEFTVPANVTQVRVAIRDLFGRGAPQFLYRLEIAPAARPRFAVTTNVTAIQLPAQGTALVELNVSRAAYNGPLALSLTGVDGVTLAPAQIPAGVSGAVLIRLESSLAAPLEFPLVQLSASTVGVEPVVRQTVVRPDVEGFSIAADTLALGSLPAAGLKFDVVNPPTQLFKGAPATLQVQIGRENSSEPSAALRITSLSTEPVRFQQANNPGSGKLPGIEIAAGTILDSQTNSGTVTLNVPLDVAVKDLELALVADVLAHPYSERPLATAVALPFRATVETAVAPKLDVPSLHVVAESAHEVTGKLERTKGFTSPVQVTLTGLPKEYKMQPAVVPGDQNEFKIIVTAPAVTAAAVIPNVKLQVTTSGSPIAADQDVPLRIAPKPASPAAAQ